MKAGVAELEDAPGLGPGGRCPWRFESSHPHEDPAVGGGKPPGPGRRGEPSGDEVTGLGLTLG